MTDRGRFIDKIAACYLFVVVVGLVVGWIYCDPCKYFNLNNSHNRA